MTRSKCGLLLLLAAGATACGGDPTDSFREADQKIVADPSVVFVSQDASVFVVAQLQDDQGNQLPGEFEAVNAGPEVSVVRDSTFLETTNGTSLKTRARFVVTGLAPGASSFEITSGGVTDTVPVSVIPTGIAATFSNASPALNEPVTITLPAGYTFGADAAIESDLGPGIVQSVSEDGTSITAIIPPGSTGSVTLSGVSADFLPGLPLTLPSIDVVSASPTGLPGTDAVTTAPELPVPALGETVSLLDAGTFTGADISGDGGLALAQYYKITVADSGSYTVATSWPGTADVDEVLCFDVGCAEAAFDGASANNPESATFDLDTGTYYLAVVLFAGGAPPFIQLSLTHEIPVETGD
ncbi:MAG TPA: hypothetical protein VFG66_07835 [Gemmatimonadales bacterium]|nr:hypothetical protein [Gemmatimonadales bacterium]